MLGQSGEISISGERDVCVIQPIFTLSAVMNLTAASVGKLIIAVFFMAPCPISLRLNCFFISFSGRSSFCPFYSYQFSGLLSLVKRPFSSSHLPGIPTTHWHRPNFVWSPSCFCFPRDRATWWLVVFLLQCHTIRKFIVPYRSLDVLIDIPPLFNYLS